jgi:chromosomal replication initiator protein
VERSLQRLWADTLALAERELPRPSFETCLRKTRPVAAYDTYLIVAADNDFARDVAERHAPLLRDTLSRCAGRPMDVSFVTALSANAEPPTSTDPSLPPAPGQNSLTPQPARRGPSRAARESADAEMLDSPAPATTVDSLQRPLNPRYTFETFVAAPNSHLTFSASIAVADAPARVYNPLFIYGGVGLGKTHLLQAVAHRVLARNANVLVAYVTSERFTNELVDAIKDRTTEDFRNRYRTVDVLLVDDVQFLTGKESTQEEFFHTFNCLYEMDKQIVLSSDRPPKEIATLEERLRSRFEWGLITDIQPPDLETRTAILRKKAELERLPIPNEAIRYIAERINTNIRELEGALVRVVAFASLHKRPMDEALAEEALRDILPQTRPRQVTIGLIQEVVADYYQLDVKDLKIRKRTRAVAYPRQVAMYLCRELTDASLPRIGEQFGGRDHTTVIHAHEKIARELATDAGMRATVNGLRKRIVG